MTRLIHTVRTRRPPEGQVEELWGGGAGRQVLRANLIELVSYLVLTTVVVDVADVDAPAVGGLASLVGLPNMGRRRAERSAAQAGCAQGPGRR